MSKLRSLDDEEQLGDFFKVTLKIPYSVSSAQVGERSVAHVVQKRRADSWPRLVWNPSHSRSSKSSYRSKSLPTLNTTNVRTGSTDNINPEEEFVENLATFNLKFEEVRRSKNISKFYFVSDNKTNENIRKSLRPIKGDAKEDTKKIILNAEKKYSAVCNNLMSCVNIPFGYRFSQGLLPCLCTHCNNFTQKGKLQ